MWRKLAFITHHQHLFFHQMWFLINAFVKHLGKIEKTNLSDVLWFPYPCLPSSAIYYPQASGEHLSSLLNPLESQGEIQQPHLKQPCRWASHWCHWPQEDRDTVTISCLKADVWAERAILFISSFPPFPALKWLWGKKIFFPTKIWTQLI